MMCMTCGCGTSDVYIRGRQAKRAANAGLAVRFRPHVTEVVDSEASHASLSHVNESQLEFPHENQKSHNPSLPPSRGKARMGVESRSLITSTPALTLPDETTSQSTKPASGQVAGYLQGGGDDGAFEFKIVDEDVSRIVKLEQDILAKNDSYAEQNRSIFSEHGILALNLVSSPGSGKTTLLVRTLEALKEKLPLAVIEGDQQTDNDAERIRATGIDAIQINTGKGCHLDAQMIERSVEQMTLPQNGMLFIENVGNLVCPAAFDLGEAAKVVVLSVTEGEDKPLKYPDMFRAAKLMLLNKCDLLPHLVFDVARVEKYARRVNPSIEIIRISATSGEGMDDWLDWLTAQHTTIAQRT